MATKRGFLKPHIFEALLLLVINYFGVLGKKSCSHVILNNFISVMNIDVLEN